MRPLWTDAALTSFNVINKSRGLAVNPIAFPQQTTVWAKNQPPYLPLPAYTNDRETITCWQLTWRERIAVFLLGRLWLRQINLGQPLQAQAPSINTPFLSLPSSR